MVLIATFVSACSGSLSGSGTGQGGGAGGGAGTGQAGTTGSAGMGQAGTTGGAGGCSFPVTDPLFDCAPSAASQLETACRSISNSPDTWIGFHCGSIQAVLTHFGSYTVNCFYNYTGQLTMAERCEAIPVPCGSGPAGACRRSVGVSDTLAGWEPSIQPGCYAFTRFCPGGDLADGGRTGGNQGSDGGDGAIGDGAGGPVDAGGDM
jgi:hypothetical protein